MLTIDLGPLRLEEARARRRLDRVLQPLRHPMHRAGRRQPLFLEQLLRGAEEGEGSGVPPTIQSLVLARMDRLAARDKAALQAAAVIGKRFPLERCTFSSTIRLRLQCLVAADLVRPDSGDYLFAHALIQEGVHLAPAQPQARAYCSPRGVVQGEELLLRERASGCARLRRHTHRSPQRMRRTASATTPRCGWRSAAPSWHRGRASPFARDAAWRSSARGRADT